MGTLCFADRYVCWCHVTPTAARPKGTHGFVYLFPNRDPDVFAISADKTGNRIPAVELSTRWFLRREITSRGDRPDFE